MPAGASRRSVAGPPAAWRRMAGALLLLLAVAGGASARAGGADTASGPTGFYAGAFAGAGWTANRLVDVAGFANWGNPGSRLSYGGSGPVGGLLVGKKFAFGGVQARIELDAAAGRLSAGTRELDPTCTDEAAESRFRWAASLRVGIERTVGGMTAFASGGPALARIVNSVTDTDYSGASCLERDLRLDPDDSFRKSAARLGLALGAGVEAPLAASWSLRLEASWLDFGRETYLVNRSGNNSCGRGGPRAPCPYTIENRLITLRLAVIRSF